MNGNNTVKHWLYYYNRGGLQTVTTDEAYQIASNFIAYNGLNIGEGTPDSPRSQPLF